MSLALVQKGGGVTYYEYIGAFLCQSYFPKAGFSAFVSLIDISPGTEYLQ